MTAAAAYGFRWTGVPGTVPGGDEAAGWPPVAVRHEAPARYADRDAVEDDQAILAVPGGSIHLRRSPREAAIRVASAPSATEIITRHAARMAAVFSTWAGRPTFQAGAVADGSRALAVAGPMLAGKTTLLEAYARAGGLVFCDEVIATDRGRVLAGTPLLRLRPDALEAIGPAVAARSAPPRATLPLAGFAFLEWGPEAALTPMGPAERLAALDGARVAGSSSQPPPEVLDLVRLPAWRLVRPSGWDRLHEGVGLLRRALASSGEAARAR
ncbi:MAG TPA: hypothetical protein VJT75_04520 [Thermoleophilaceae bacterium]|nr:hypothetical protein [Thermoleophilaceae bacterium]